MTKPPHAAERLRQLPPLSAPEPLLERVLDRLHYEHDRQQGADDELMGALKTLPPIAAPRRVLSGAALRLRGEHARAADRSWRWAVVGAALATVAGVVVAVDLFPSRESVEPQPTAQTEQTPREPPARHVTVTAGSVTIVRGGETLALPADGGVEEGDRLATGARGQATIRYGTNATVRLDRHSEVVLHPGAALDVLRGRTEGSVGARRHTIDFLFQKRAVRLLHGTVGVLRAADNRMAVASLDGDALVEVSGEELLLPQGRQLRMHGQRWEIEPLPQRWTVALDKVRAIGKSTRSVAVEGHTGTDVMLIINHRSIAVDHDGRFVATVAAGASGKVTAVARDAAGRTRKASRRVLPVSSTHRWGEPG